MELVVNQQIYYSNKKLIPIEDVADSLLALERVIRHSPSYDYFWCMTREKEAV